MQVNHIQDVCWYSRELHQPLRHIVLCPIADWLPHLSRVSEATEGADPGGRPRRRGSIIVSGHRNCHWLCRRSRLGCCQGDGFTKAYNWSTVASTWRRRYALPLGRCLNWKLGRRPREDVCLRPCKDPRGSRDRGGTTHGSLRSPRCHRHLEARVLLHGLELQRQGDGFWQVACIWWSSHQLPGFWIRWMGEGHLWPWRKRRDVTCSLECLQSCRTGLCQELVQHSIWPS
mmetsp:Transcript_94142/g.224084  ORF Transcript_94142/g.224084 Transcript_94142/m.224084 type:complete len:230 (-) Transcript_94142:545-1234(-)